MFRNRNAAITLSVALNGVIKKLQTHENEKRLARVLSSKNTILHALSLARSLAIYQHSDDQGAGYVRRISERLLTLKRA
jgi:hypothetical protein